LKCYKSVSEIKKRVDLAVIVIPPEFSNKAVLECAKKGVKGCIIITAGYKEVGGEGAKREEELEKIVKRYKIRCIGPNCLGVFNPSSGVDTLFLPVFKLKRPEDGKIAIIAQSGAFGSVLLDLAADSGLGISKFVSYGNAVDIDEADLIKFFGNDKETKAITAYIEGVKNGRKFLETCYKVSRKKPIIVLKAGKSSKGSEAATSHTGSLAGKYSIYKGAFKQCGIIEALTIEQMFDFSRILSYESEIKGNRVAVVTNGGGFGVLSTDAIERNGLNLVEFEEEVRKKLQKVLPNYAKVHNPLDLIGDATPERYRGALEILMDYEGVDVILVVALMQTASMNSQIIDIFADLKQEYKKPFVVCMAGGEYTRIHSSNLEKLGIPVYPTPTRAADSIKALYDYWNWRRKHKNYRSNHQNFNY
jgi:acetyl coenzyme A synthetase (ADP forming)-like protein